MDGSVSAPLPDWWGRKDYAVLKAEQVFGSVKGRKALHKILYFANLETDMFKYQWYAYGPYSTELAYKIADHVLYRHLDEDDAGGKTRHDMSLSESGGRLLGGARHEHIDSALGRAHALLRDAPPRRMDLLASVHYAFSCVREPGKVCGFMQALKPAANFTAVDVEEALLFLQSKSVIDLEKTDDRRGPERIRA